MENEKQKNDYWQIIYTVSFVVILPSLGRIFRNSLPFTINSTLLACILGALGGLIGYGLYSLVKNKKLVLKILVYVAMLFVLFAASFTAGKLTSDSHLVKKEWKLIDNGKMSFEYPYGFSEMKLDFHDKDAQMKIFNDGKDDRFSFNMIIDFNIEPPEPQDSLTGSMMSSLTNMGAEEVEWQDSQVYENGVSTKVKYKIGKDERLGFGMLYHDGSHYEIATFLPFKKDYSEEFMERLIGSFSVSE